MTHPLLRVLVALWTLPGIYIHLLNQNYDGATFWVCAGIYWLLLLARRPTPPSKPSGDLK